ncbi:PD-(D/E)XK nuclease family protein [Paraburkholderia sediminicola]|uniref:PD-(D/E)XK nuclease family protein n=1 Tax=Paraburkholderia sediminicola TaxID=458836 RepID=UPI0038B99E11
MTGAENYTRVIEVRASSWGALFDCSFKWEGEHLLGMRRPSGIRALLGTAVHAGTAAFDQAKLDKNPITAMQAADYLLDALHQPTDDVDYKQDTSINMRQAEQIGLALLTKYCHEISPRYEFRAIEMKMEPLDIDCGDGLIIRLKGTMDRSRVAESQDGNGDVIPDVKTGARLFDAENNVILKARSAQLGAYSLMYENQTDRHTVGGQIIALETASQARVGVSPIFNVKQPMTGTPTQKGLIEYAAGMFKTGDFLPNPQSALCSEKFCARYSTCIFHD